MVKYESINTDDETREKKTEDAPSKSYQTQASSSSSIVDIAAYLPATTNDHRRRRHSTGGSLVHSMRNSISDGLSLAGSFSSSVRDLIVNHGLSQSGGRPMSVRQLAGQSTLSRSSFTLIKNLVGAGVLALPSGVAAFADSKAAIGPASVWLIIMGIIFGYEFQLIAKVCDMTYAVTFREAWDDSVGMSQNEFVSQHLGVVVSWVNAGKPFLGNLAYSMILADTFRSLFAAFGWDVSRTTSLLLITILGIVPLCLMKNLDALAPFSILGTLSIVVIAACMCIRCFDGTYDPTSGIFVGDLPEDLQPLFGSYNGCWTAAVLVYVAMIFEAFVAHYNSPRLYTELKDTSIARIRVVVSSGFGASTVIYILIMCFGFSTFGAASSGYILNNYSSHDPIMTTSRFLIAFSILFTYPVTFFGTRDGVLDILKLPEEKQTSININIITIFLLLIITVLAVFTTDLGMVNAVGGGSLATLIVFVFPANMFWAAIDHRRAPPSNEEKREVVFAMILMILGLIMGIIGVVVAVS